MEKIKVMFCGKLIVVLVKGYNNVVEIYFMDKNICR